MKCVGCETENGYYRTVKKVVRKEWVCRKCGKTQRQKVNLKNTDEGK